MVERRAFLEEAARYFEKSDTKGEDSAHWANVYNAQNCREIAASLTTQDVASELAMSGWQPIETAPRDGTEVILYGLYPQNDEGLPTQRVTAGFWLVPEPPVLGDCGGECRCPEYGDPEAPHWCTMHGGSDSGWMSTDGGFTTEWPATRWMPLPEPPAASLRAHGEIIEGEGV